MKIQGVQDSSTCQTLLLPGDGVGGRPTAGRRKPPSAGTQIVLRGKRKQFIKGARKGRSISGPQTLVLASAPPPPRPLPPVCPPPRDAPAPEVHIPQCNRSFVTSDQ